MISATGTPLLRRRNRPRRVGVALLELAGVLALALGLTTGCAPAPVGGPPLAVSRHGSGHDRSNHGSENHNHTAEAQGTAQNDSADPFGGPLPTLSADLPQAPCSYPFPELAGEADHFCLHARPEGASYDLKPLEAVVFFGPEAPLSTPPLVILSGPDRDWSATAMGWAHAMTAGLGRPVAVVNPRTSSLQSESCVLSVAELTDNLLVGHRAADDPIFREIPAKLSRACQDGRERDYLKFGGATAAEDLGLMLDRLGLPRAILGSSGAGVQGLAAFLSAHPERAAGAVLDSPPTLSQRLYDLFAARAEGSQMAFDSWLAACREHDCLSRPLPARAPKIADIAFSGTVAQALRRARNALSLTDGATEAAINQQLGDSLDALANRRGPRQTTASNDVPTRDFFATCTDYPERPQNQGYGAVITDLEGRFGLWGTDAAYRQLACSDWPVSAASAPRLPKIPVLSIGRTGGDPLAGRDPAGTGAAEFAAAGTASPITLRRGGFGSVTVTGDQCTATAIKDFLNQPSSSRPRSCPN